MDHLNPQRLASVSQRGEKSQTEGLLRMSLEPNLDSAWIACLVVGSCPKSGMIVVAQHGPCPVALSDPN